MPTKIEGRSLRQDLIDDIVEAPSSSSFMSSSASSILVDNSKSLPNRNYSSYSNIPSLFNNKTKNEQTDRTTILTNELRDRLHLTLPRSSSSSTMISNDERRRELDLVLKHLYDGKLLTSMNDDRPSSDISESSIPILSKGPITKTTTTMIKNDDDNKINVGNMEILSLDDDCTSLQRELQEKELDIMHLNKEIHELQLENKLLKAKVPVIYPNGHTSNNTETEVLRREKDVLQNELRSQQQLIAKLQQQQQQNGVINRSNKLDEATLYQKETLERKLRSQHRNNGNYDNQHRLQRHQHPTDGTNDYMSPSLPTQSSSHVYQQNYGLSRSAALPESHHHSRRSNSYTMSNRQMNNENDIHEDRHHGRHRQQSIETTSPRRPYAPSSITDIHLNDIIKFSRPGGKISKGVVKYIGSLPGKNDQYLGLELEDEESKHDGVYQGERLFQCKPNKGVFVGFSKVIMAWSGK
ncbi:unnamed protein product [Rotaria sordida]|uniref:CAP-Gly domain-containing protein n=1 Tax=Rotaria sordida TaxID=392033 RepID=A0A813TQZ1_9BILA|nr:unnamed protein product [Rotaria sordida]